MAKTGRRRRGRGTGPAEGAGSWLERHALLCLGGLLLLALGLRLAGLESLRQGPYGSFLLWDERYYHAWALQLAEGTFQSSLPYRAAPLPAYLMGLIYALLGPDPFFIRLLNLLLGTLTCYLIYRIGRDLFGEAVGLLAGLLAAVYKPLIFYSVVPLKTALAVCLFALVAALTVAVLRGAGWPAAVALGAGVGLLLNVQGNGLALAAAVPVLLLAAACLRWRRPGDPHAPAGPRRLLLACLCLAGGLAAAAAPFALRNYRVAGELVLTTPQAGFALYAGNRLDNPDPYFRPVPFAVPVPAEQLAQMTIEASRRAGRALSPREASAFWGRETLRQARERPLQMGRKLGQKLLAVLHRSEVSDNYHLGFVSRFAPVFRIPLLAFWALLPLAAAGAVLALRRSRLPAALLGLGAAYAATLVLFYPGARFRLPLVVVLLPLAAVTLRALAAPGAVGGWARWRLPAAAAALFALLPFVPLQAADDLTAAYNTHAILLTERQRPEEAAAYWERSARAGGSYAPFAELALAGRAARAGELEGAARRLERISDDGFAAASKHDLLGDIRAVQGRRREAIEAYRRSLAINPGQRVTRAKLIRSLKGDDPAGARREAERLQEITAFYEPDPPAARPPGP